MNDRELLVLRHGAAWPAAEDDDDAARPIKDGGKRDAQRVGVWIAQQALAIDHVVASPAERALVSAQKACKAMGLTGGHPHPEPRLYPGDLEGALEVLAGCPPTAARVLLVGHNPALRPLLDHLLGVEGHRLRKGSLVRLGMPRSWATLERGCARLLDRIDADDLPRLFPFPAPHGAERRKRPAYYYTQSAVVPWRERDGRLEVLVIGSSKSGHPVVPKGIVDPGLSPMASAAKEAEEEAGIAGEVSAEPLGSYTCPKWGATCTVSVFPMRVTQVMPEAEWEERHRTRRWMSPEEAAAALRQRELAPMVLALPGRVGKDPPSRS